MSSRRILLPLACATALSALFTAPAQAASSHDRSLVVRTLASGGWKALPVSGAAVRVLRGNRVIAHSRLGSRGMAVLRTHGTVPANFRVLVSGGSVAGKPFYGTLAAEVHGYTWPETVHVDSVTTLAARYQRHHPRLSLARAEQRTKRFLSLPRSYVIGLDGRGNVEFDGRRFLGAAPPRSYDAFVGRLVGKIDRRRAKRSFAHNQPRRADLAGAHAAVTPVSGGADALEGVTEAISAGTGFFDVLEKTDEVLDFADAVMSIAGVNNDAASSAEVRELNAQLQQVEQSLAVVETAVAELRGENTESAYSELAGGVAETQSEVVSGEDTLHSAVLLAEQEGCTPTSTGNGCDEARELLTGPAGFQANIRAAGLVTPSQVNAYAEQIGGDVLPGAAAGANGLVQYGSRLTTDGQDQMFYTPEDSEQLQSIAAYWASSYSEALAIVSTYWGLDGAAPATLRNDVEQLEANAAAVPRLVPAAVEPGTVVDMVNGNMWPTEASGYGTSHPFSWFAENNNWEYSAGQWISSSGSGVTVPAWTSEEAPEIPHSDWMVAGTIQIDPMLQAVTPHGNQLEGGAVLAQSGIDRAIVTPRYEFGNEGLEVQYRDYIDGGSGCYGESSSCFWPIWVADGSTVGNFHESTGKYAGPYRYVDGTFKTDKFLDVEWAGQSLYGYDNEGTIYGNAPENSIPNLFFRSVKLGECYFYPAPGIATAGSPDCPGR